MKMSEAPMVRDEDGRQRGADDRTHAAEDGLTPPTTAAVMMDSSRPAGTTVWIE